VTRTPSDNVKSTEDVLDRANAEFAGGRAWRAKEILRGNIAAGRVEPEILETYGRLLERFGERIEAGKYLFLSGVRKPEYVEAISLFKHRHARRSGPDLIAQLPAAVRLKPFAALPETVQRELQAMGVTADMFSGPRARRAMGTSWPGRFGIVGCLLLSIVLLVALVEGLKVVGSWIWEWIT
jgi:hypothetical protein